MPTVEDVIADALTKLSVWTEHDLRVRAIAAALREAGMVEEWKPIETAPKDGTWVILAGGTPDASHDGRIDEQEGFQPMTVARFNDIRDSYWEYASYDGGFYGEWENPTHWRPLPSLPVKPGL